MATPSRVARAVARRRARARACRVRGTRGLCAPEDVDVDCGWLCDRKIGPKIE